MRAEKNECLIEFSETVKTQKAQTEQRDEGGNETMDEELLNQVECALRDKWRHEKEEKMCHLE